jgi:hypothetical protein
LVLAITGTLWLLWSFPRLHSANSLQLRCDREGYFAQARRIAAGNGANLAGWKSYVELDTARKNQLFQATQPHDETAQAFPAATIQVTFIPRGGETATVTMRADGRPLNWKLPAPSTDSHADARTVAESALRRIAGDDTNKFAVTSAGTGGHGGALFAWHRRQDGPDPAGIKIEISVKNGMAWRADTTFTRPEKVASRYDDVSVPRFVMGLAWFVLLFAALAVAILREGGQLVRSMRDPAAIRLGLAVGLMTAISVGLQDDIIVSATEASSTVTNILGIVVGGLFMGFMAYAVLAGTILNVRLHASRVRGLRLLPTGAIFSRTVGREVLGGWLAAPLLVSIPLASSALVGLRVYRGYEDSSILNAWPAITSLVSLPDQGILAALAMLGLLIPLGLRFSRRAWLCWGVIAFSAWLTFAMLDAPFLQSQVANLLPTALLALVVFCVYSQFGILGALTAQGVASLITIASVLLVQPAAGLHGPGLEVLAVTGCAGILALAAALVGPESAVVLPGETGVSTPARSRREELRTEFSVARSAQQQMLPARPPLLDGYTLAASCEPAREVGGDLYDFIPLSGGRWGIGVADVSGKGVPAALYMTLTKGLLCAAGQDSGDPSEILKSVNTHLHEVARRKVFVTMALGVLDTATRTVDYARAGHNPVVWRRAAQGRTTLLSSSGMGLGLSARSVFARTLAVQRIVLEPGDALVFYSDGLTEAMNQSLEQFGEERLIAAVERTDGMHAEDTRDSILKDVRVFLDGIHPQDDLTIAVLRVNRELESEIGSNGR